MEFSHVSVLAQACIEGLNIRPDGVYVDATTGGGGHSSLIAERIDTGRLICIDRDAEALAAAGRRLIPFQDRITFVKSNFEDLRTVLQDLEIPAINGVLFDLGVSSYQLDNPERGFSYMQDAPLDMRMDREQSFSAYELVNESAEAELARIISLYGEERFARRIATGIIRKRAQEPIRTTRELADVIRGSMPAPALREKQHPAKRTFQAIRIAVNGELKAVEQAVAEAIDLCAPGGRVAVISFHSLEDRIVKTLFAEAARGCTCPPEFPICVCGKKPRVRLVNKGGTIPTPEEQEQNPRARSARLRVAEKI
ncbi:MAG: 16S rRNA (cytosine(1402)-N(4))-methyltransferase RsmH [Clostridiaceae bacterium]|nr:16S rRNA (cytosine(1402)-N(4))-methyltransferase RsmH [Clostridiaceae bacterium]